MITQKNLRQTEEICIVDIKKSICSIRLEQNSVAVAINILTVLNAWRAKIRKL